jgi:chitinase
MIWAIDQVDQKEKSLNYPPDFTEEEIMDAELVIQDEAAQGTCFTTQCGAKCNGGEYEAAQMNGQPGDLSVLPRCQKGEFRRLCCAKGTVMGKCRWRGYRGLLQAIPTSKRHHIDASNRSRIKLSGRVWRRRD